MHPLAACFIFSRRNIVSKVVFAGQASFTQSMCRTYWLLVLCRVLKQLLHFVKEHQQGGSIASWLRARCLPWIMGNRHRPDMMTPVLMLRNYLRHGGAEISARGGAYVERSVSSSHSLHLVILDHPFHSLLAHLLDASHPFRKDQLISQSVQALVRTVVLANITRPADPTLRTKPISMPMPPKDKRLGISHSRFDTVVEVREDSIPRDADIPHTLRNVHHVRRDRRRRHEHKETRSRTVWRAEKRGRCRPAKVPEYTKELGRLG